MLKSGFSIFSTQEIGSSLISFQMIFEGLLLVQSELFRLNSFHEFENPKIPEFNLVMD